MWSQLKLEKNLQRAIQELNLEADIMPQVRFVTEHEKPQKAGKTAEFMLYAATFSATFAFFVYLLDWQGWEPEFSSPQAAVKGAACLGSIIIGLILAFGARRFSRLDCLLVNKLTGRATTASGLDIILVRAGALLLLVFSTLLQLLPGV